MTHGDPLLRHAGDSRTTSLIRCSVREFDALGEADVERPGSHQRHPRLQVRAQRLGGQRQHDGGRPVERLGGVPGGPDRRGQGDATPTALNTEYSSGEAWPLEKIRWSLAASRGSSQS